MPGVGRFVVGALAFACGLCAAARPASALQTELVGALGVEAPATSDYRSEINQVGYGLGYPRLGYEAELGARFALAFDRRLWIGPIARLDVQRLGAPYGGLDTVWAEAAYLAVREEFLFAKFPPLFLWADEAYGVARIGVSGSYASSTTWGVRGGVGIRIGWPRDALRARVGWSWAPTNDGFAGAGKYDFGGFIFTIDGVLRVVDE